MVGEALGQALEIVELDHLRPVLHPQVLLPVRAEALDRNAECRRKRTVQATPALKRTQELVHFLAAVLLFDITEERLAFAIDEVAHLIRQVIERHQPVIDDQVAHEVIGADVHPAGLILGEPLGHPERDVELIDCPEQRCKLRPVVHLELEDMGQFVADDVVQIVVRPVKRDHDAILDNLGETAHALVYHVRDHVGLAELAGRKIQNERDLPFDLNAEVAGSLGVVFFC